MFSFKRYFIIIINDLSLMHACNNDSLFDVNNKRKTSTKKIIIIIFATTTDRKTMLSQWFLQFLPRSGTCPEKISLRFNTHFKWYCFIYQIGSPVIQSYTLICGSCLNNYGGIDAQLIGGTYLLIIQCLNKKVYIFKLYKEVTTNAVSSGTAFLVYIFFICLSFHWYTCRRIGKIIQDSRQTSVFIFIK